jgi:hypothetical protein
VRHDLVAAPADRRHDLRRVLVHQAVGVVRGGKLQLVEELEQPPDADAIAVVAPGIVAVRLRLVVLGIVVPAPFAIRVHGKIGRQAECEALASRPIVIPALRDRRIVVSAVAGQ